MANKTQKQYTDEYLLQGQATLDAQYGKKKEATAKRKQEQTAATDEYITGAHKVIDAGLAKSTQKVQSQIDAAPGEYQETFDRNALSEELGRHAVELKMANMGMTDSGLNRSAQTALAAQRINADAKARKSMREYVDKLETLIADMTVEAQSKKDQLSLDARKADKDTFSGWDASVEDWYANANANLQTAAADYGASMWQADENNRALVKKAEIEAGVEKAKLSSAAEKDAQDRAHKVFLKLLDSGKTYEEAMEMVYGAVEEDSEEAEQKKALQYEENYRDILLSIEGYDVGGWTTFWSTPVGDAKNVYDEIVTSNLKKNATFMSLPLDQQLTIASAAIGKSVAKTWSADGDNGNRIEHAITRLINEFCGVDKSEGQLENYRNIIFNERTDKDLSTLGWRLRQAAWVEYNKTHDKY